MPRVSYSQTNFTSGELSPRIYGRTDLDRYGNGLEEATNVIALIHGGSPRRPGTLYVNAAKYANKRSRLVPFVFSQDVAYMLEFGDLYVRVYKDSAQVAEIVSPYDEDDVQTLDFCQGEDTMFLTHQLFIPRRLRRFSDSSWAIDEVPFTTRPFDEQGHVPLIDLTLSSAAVGSRTATLTTGFFLPSDVGRTLSCGPGVGTVTGYTSATVVTLDVTSAFASTALAGGTWILNDSPYALIRASKAGVVGETISLYGAPSRNATVTLSAKTGAITLTASASIFAPADVGKKFWAGAGEAAITGYTSGTQVSATTSTDFEDTTYNTGGFGMTGDVWRGGDVLDYVRLNSGLLQIQLWVNAAEVTARVITEMDGLVAAAPLSWSLEQSVWDDVNGYPRTCTLHEQRLWFAGSVRYPQTVWGSRTAEYLDFTKGTDDDSAVSFTIASNEVNPISYLMSMRTLVAHTYGGEFSIQGGVEKPITPTNIRVRQESAHGCTSVRPVMVGRESVFVQRAGRKVRSLGYRYDVDGYTAPDLSALAEHITVYGVTEMAWQQEPDQLLWAVRGDGAMLTCTIDRDQSVIAWDKHYTDGAFESVAAIPAGDREVVYAIVHRTVNGSTVRYLERFDDTTEPIASAAPTGYPPFAEPLVYGCTVDCGKVIDSVGGTDTFSGLGHLEGCEVDVVADGLPMGSFTVAAGAIVLPRDAFRVIVGLHFQSRMVLLTPEIGTGTGTAQGNSMRVSEVSIRFLKTIGAQVYDGDGNLVGDLSFRQFGPGILDAAPAPFTGLKRMEQLGWERGRAKLVIVQDQPLPFHVQSVVRKLQVND